MDFGDIIETRCSTRNCDGRSVPRDVLMRIAAAGNRAPTARNMQTKRFVFVGDRDLIKELIPMCVGQRWLDVGTIVFVCGTPKTTTSPTASPPRPSTTPSRPRTS